VGGPPGMRSTNEVLRVSRGRPDAFLILSRSLLASFPPVFPRSSRPPTFVLAKLPIWSQGRELRPRRPHPLLRESSRRPSRPRPRVRVRVRARGVTHRRVTSGSGSCVDRIGLGGNALVNTPADSVGVGPGIGRQSIGCTRLGIEWALLRTSM
jgi:hypothetical protein